MNMTGNAYATAQLRASDADRDAALADLSAHFQAGRLTSDELDERTGRALAARTVGELGDLMDDLPALQPASPAPVPAKAGLRRPGPSLTVLLVTLAAAAMVLSVTAGHHRSGIWWAIPVGLLIARRVLFSRRARRPTSRYGR
jgi:Flp pilus assembly protein TadB